MTKPHYALTTLPSGEKQVTLAPIGGPIEKVLYWGMVGGTLAGGWFLLPGFMGYAMLATGVMGVFLLYRTTNRKETWVVKPGSATRTVVFIGTRVETFVPLGVRAEAETDSEDGRRELRLMLTHQNGKVQIGTHTFDHDARALELAKVMGEAMSVAVELPE